MPAREEFPEDTLPLLAPAIATQTPRSFYDHVTSLHAATKRVAKRRPTTIKGRVVTTATKKRQGVYEISVAVHGTHIEAPFDRDKNIALDVAVTALRLLVTPEMLTAFLVKKKFVVVPSLTTPALPA